MKSQVRMVLQCLVYLLVSEVREAHCSTVLSLDVRPEMQTKLF